MTLRLRVILPDDVRKQYGIDERLVDLDLDALLDLPFDEVVKLEEAMVGGPSLGRLRVHDLYEYTAQALRAVAWLTLRQHGHNPDWATFKPDPGHTLYVVDALEADADPPEGGDSSPDAPPEQS